jgi:hypothetical protein
MKPVISETSDDCLYDPYTSDYNGSCSAFVVLLKKDSTKIKKSETECFFRYYKLISPIFRTPQKNEFSCSKKAPPS